MPGVAAWAGALVGVFVSAALAVGGGVGGGSLFLAIFGLTLHIDTHLGVPLSQVGIFGLSLGGFLVNLNKKHPLAKNRPLIDYGQRGF